MVSLAVCYVPEIKSWITGTLITLPIFLHHRDCNQLSYLKSEILPPKNPFFGRECFPGEFTCVFSNVPIGVHDLSHTIK